MRSTKRSALNAMVIAGEAWLCHPMTYPEFQRSLLWEMAASLPTPDEWAYLCGGGCRTLFPWGDGLDYSDATAPL